MQAGGRDQVDQVLPGCVLGWLFLRGDEVPAVCADPDAGDNAWLGPLEREALSRLRVPKRRGEWLLGRWTGKQAALRFGAALVSELAAPGDAALLRRVQILAAADGAPELWLDDLRLPLAVSLSHRHACALAVIGSADGGQALLGCDLEYIETRSELFIRDYFTAGEQALMAAAGDMDPSAAATLLWSAKESALKALRLGLRRDTRSVEVTMDAQALMDVLTEGGEQRWRGFSVRDLVTGQRFAGNACRLGHHVLTIAACEEPAA